MRSHPQHDSLHRAVFCIAVFAIGEICINLLLARIRADQVSKFSHRLLTAVHFAFISLNAG
jgi:hypothetical protein